MGNAFYGQIFSDNEAFIYILSFSNLSNIQSLYLHRSNLGRTQSPVYIELYAYSAPSLCTPTEKVFFNIKYLSFLTSAAATCSTLCKHELDDRRVCFRTFWPAVHLTPWNCVVLNLDSSWKWSVCNSHPVCTRHYFLQIFT